MKCTQCNCSLPDKDKSICQYSYSNHRVCRDCYDEISKWNDSEARTYKQFDEQAHKAYPKIFTDPLFYKKIGKY